MVEKIEIKTHRFVNTADPATPISVRICLSLIRSVPVSVLGFGLSGPASYPVVTHSVQSVDVPALAPPPIPVPTHSTSTHASTDLRL